MADAIRIGVYSGCTHGPNGGRAEDCIPCAIRWHTERHVDASERAEYHLRTIRALEDFQIARNLANSSALEAKEAG